MHLYHPALTVVTPFSKAIANLPNAAAKLLLRPSKRSHVTCLVAPHCLPIKFRIRFKVLLTTYRALPGQSPADITDLLHPYVTSRSVWSSDQSLLVVPPSRLKTKTDHAFEFEAPKFYNSLQLDLRSVDTVCTFKK